MPAAVAAFAVVAFAQSACGDDDDAPADATPSAAASSIASPANSPTPTGGANPPSVTVTVVPTPAGATADSLVRSPRYILYDVGEGDTIDFIAAAFSGTSGPAPAGLADELRQLNRLVSGQLNPGASLVIPLRLDSSGSLAPEASLAAAIGIGGKAGKLVILQPNTAMREGFLGKLVLHHVFLADGAPEREGYGFLMEYWLADRGAVKDGVIDPDARVAEPGLIVAGGVYAENLQASQPGDLYRFERDGVAYAVKILRGVRRPAAELATMLE